MFCYSLGAFKAGMALSRILPKSLIYGIATRLGRMGYRRLPDARDALRANLGQVTECSGPAFDALCERNIEHFSLMIADYLLNAGRASFADHLLDQWRGFENLEAALARGKGVILVTAHLGNWELGGNLLAEKGLPMSIITLEEPSSALSGWRQAHRLRMGIKTITVGPGHDFAFVEMIQALRRNEIVAMLVDRPYASSGTPVDFFGRPAEFSTGPALLWQHTDAAVVPAFVLRNERDLYTSFADPMLAFASSSNPRQTLQDNTQRLATYFETIIREHPEQWFNYVPIWNQTPPKS